MRFDDVIFTVFKLLHPWNVSYSIDVTLDGILIDVNDPHPLNALSAIDVTEGGIVIDVRILQLQKAWPPIEVIFDVIFTVFKIVHPLNV